ncbi:MAG: hypothetical protein K5910_05200 [Bacteroidales bacterium]|nr:hypothetical protein [Bacteroidales bacterium]
MCKVRKADLLFVNGLLWSLIGIKISMTGISHYLQLPESEALWWRILLSLSVFAAFYAMFSGIVRKYSERILSLPGPRESIFKTFSVKGYILVAFMISLGIVLKRVPGVPSGFFAWFYCGLGPGLLSAGIRFLIRWVRTRG